MFLWESLLLKSEETSGEETPLQGALYSWGDNIYGKTGQGTDSGQTFVPTQVGSDTDWMDCKAGGLHSVAIKNNSLYSWGYGQYIGQNTTANISTPQQCYVQDVTSSVSDISTGSLFSCYIQDGKLYSFGINQFGVTGLNTVSGITTIPTQIATAFSDWSKVSSSLLHSLAIRNTYLYSWGINQQGRTGLNTITGNTLVPTQIGSDSAWTHCSAGYRHSLAIKNGQLFSFGSNAHGATGLNTTSGSTNIPTQIGSNSDWTDCSAGHDFSLGVRDGKLYSWGENAYGATGRGTSSGNTLIPTQIGSDSGWTHCSAGAFASLAIKNGQLFSFGRGTTYATGLGTTANVLVPIQIGSNSDWIYCYTSNHDDLYGSSCGIRSSNGVSGSIYVWGNNRGDNFLGIGLTANYISSPVKLSDLENFKKITICSRGTSGNHLLVVTDEGEVYGCGSNTNGQLGLDFATATTSSLIGIGSSFSYPENVTKASIGYRSILCINDGRIYFTGDGSNFLNPFKALILKLTLLGPYKDWTDCSVGFEHNLGIRNGKLYSWGDNIYGGTGQGTILVETIVPTQVGSSDGWTKCSAGYQYSLCINNGALYAFGRGAYNATGLGTIANTLSPTQVGSNTNWTDITTNIFDDVSHSFGISNNNLYSWGDNGNFRTDQNTTSGNTATPTQVGSNQWKAIGVAGMSVFDGFSVAIDNAGYLYTVGSNVLYATGQNTNSGNTSTLTQIGSDNTWFACSAGNGFGLAIKTV